MRVFIDKERLLEQLKRISSNEYDYLLYSEVIQKIESLQNIQDELKSEFLMHLFDFCWKVKQLLEQKRKFQQKIDDLKKFEEEFKINTIAINYSRNLITELQSSFEKLTQEKKQLNLKKKDLAPKLQSQEKGNKIRTIVLKYCYKILNKSQKTLNQCENFIKFQTLFCQLFAFKITFLGHLSQQNQLKCLGQLVNFVISKKENIEILDLYEKWFAGDSQSVKNLSFLLKLFKSDLVLMKFVNNADQFQLLEFLLLQKTARPSTLMVLDSIGIFKNSILGLVFSEQVLEQFIDFENSSEREILWEKLLKENQIMIEELDFKQSGFESSQKIKRVQFIKYSENMKIESPFEQTVFLQNSQNNIISQDSQFMKEINANCIMINLNEFNQNDSWMDVKVTLLRNLIPNTHQALLEKKQNYLSLLKEKRQNQQDFLQILENESKFKENFQSFTQHAFAIIQQMQKIKQEKFSILGDLDVFYNQHPLLASYSNIISLCYSSFCNLSTLLGENLYSWQNFLELVNQIVSKIIRDIINNKQMQKQEEEEIKKQKKQKNDIKIEDQEQGSPNSQFSKDENIEENSSSSNLKTFDNNISINEDFFQNYVIPGIWALLISGISPEYIPCAALIYSLKIALKKKDIDQKFYEAFYSFFFSLDDAIFWKNDHKFMKKAKPPFDNEGDIDIKKFNEFLSQHSIRNKNFDTFLVSLESLIKENPSLIHQKSIIKQLLKKNFEQIPLFDQIFISCLGKKSLLKRKLSQFTNEQLSSIFDYSEDLTKFHHFIKLASWNIPLSLFSSQQVNIINTVCSIASYYGVELYVIEQQTDEIEAIIIIKNAALKGNWVLISMNEFPKFYPEIKKIIYNLKTIKKITNSFRILFDLQTIEYERIPSSFLSNESVIFFMTTQNMEDMEGFNDMWVNIINNDILQLSSTQQSNLTEIICFENSIKIQNLISVNNTLIENENKNLSYSVSIQANQRENQKKSNQNFLSESKLLTLPDDIQDENLEEISEINYKVLETQESFYKDAFQIKNKII